MFCFCLTWENMILKKKRKKDQTHVRVHNPSDSVWLLLGRAASCISCPHDVSLTAPAAKCAWVEGDGGG